ncbi:unnamed protein product, partial [Brassica rapa subsp. trilocularis]
MLILIDPVAPTKTVLLTSISSAITVSNHKCNDKLGEVPNRTNLAPIRRSL